MFPDFLVVMVRDGVFVGFFWPATVGYFFSWCAPSCEMCLSARRRQAGGPSVMTVEHFQPFFDHTQDSIMFLLWQRNSLEHKFRPPCAPQTNWAGSQLFTNKTGARGIFAGAVARRLVARTMSEQMMELVQNATAPYGCALAKRSGAIASHMRCWRCQPTQGHFCSRELLPVARFVKCISASCLPQVSFCCPRRHGATMA